MPKDWKPAEEAESLLAPSEASEAARIRCISSPSWKLKASSETAETDAASCESPLRPSPRSPCPEPPALLPVRPASLPRPEARMR